LVVYALRSMIRGRTQGYYEDHVHVRDKAASRFGLWVWFRLVLGAAILAGGALYIA
jgi:hypothetical protein